MRSVRLQSTDRGLHVVDVLGSPGGIANAVEASQGHLNSIELAVNLLSMAELDRTKWAVVALRGDIDLESEARTKMLVKQSIQPWQAGVVLDLADVTFFGSCGIHLLVELLRIGLQVHIVNAPALILRVIEIVGLEDMDGFTIER